VLKTLISMPPLVMPDFRIQAAYWPPAREHPGASMQKRPHLGLSIRCSRSLPAVCLPFEGMDVSETKGVA